MYKKQQRKNLSKGLTLSAVFQIFGAAVKALSSEKRGIMKILYDEYVLQTDIPVRIFNDVLAFTYVLVLFYTSKHAYIHSLDLRQSSPKPLSQNGKR